MPKPEKVCIFRLTPVVISVLDYTKGFGHTDLITCSSSWVNLAQLAEQYPTAFDPDAAKDLPEPARRFFRYTIAAGTPLHCVAEIETYLCR